LTSSPPQVLRPGGVPLEDLKRILSKVELNAVVIAEKPVHIDKARSPGMKHKHYAPKAEVIVVEGELSAVIRKINGLVEYYKTRGRRVGVLATEETSNCYVADAVKSLGSRNDLSKMARNLFRLLREFDSEGVDVIVAEGVPMEGIGLAVMNRLRKASGYHIVKAKGSNS
jgi:L-threonylcarbamoyladenylate synthase